ncbi:peptidoglycan bridge formation glycyltransferase FemA/FemB family protein [Chloroflexi bacterium TSY]|nr:peptidoglycan bridge formation glycyltransferase FemA/FemB family protein [Chloroflexi bacterium TSY]
MSILLNQAWDDFVITHPYSHFLQSSPWARFKSRFGWKDQIITHSNSQGDILNGANILYRDLLNLGMINLRIAYIPKGPIAEWSHDAETALLLHKVEEACQKAGASVLKIEPNLPDTVENRRMLRNYGFHPSQQVIQPQSTIILDISEDEEIILKQMKSKWRYNIRLSQRKGVTVREGTRNDLIHFHNLMQTTGRRDGFAVHSSAYYERAFDALVPDYATFLFAEFDDQPLAAIVVVAFGDTACYLWGASSNSERNRMPNHALQWAAIQWARARGVKKYDLWGIPDDIGKLAVGMGSLPNSSVSVNELPLDLGKVVAHDELWGVYRLKQGFGGHVVRFVGSWDRPISKAGYRIYTIGYNIQQKMQELRKESNPAPNGSLSDIWVFARSVHAKVLPPKALPTHLKNVESPLEWRTILATFTMPHVLQSWEWGTIKSQTGWQAERYLLLDEVWNLRAAFQFLVRQPIPNIPFAIGYIPKGPLVDWSNPVQVEHVLSAIEQVAQSKNCLFVKIDPNVREDISEGTELIRLLSQRGWKRSHEQIQFKNSAYSSLIPVSANKKDGSAKVGPHSHESGHKEMATPGERMLLEKMKSKWRYNIRLAARRGIQIRVGNLTDLTTFYQLYAETGERDGFVIRPYPYYKTVWSTFLVAQDDANNPAGGALLLAEHPDESKPLAGLFLLRYGACTWYFYGASGKQRRRDMPNHLLQWEALRWAVQQGCTLYDWWGAPSNVDDPEDTLYGVWQFKRGFDAELQPHIGAWDWTPSPILHYLYREIVPDVFAILKSACGELG